MGKTFCIADIHGNYRALKQCLERSNFNYDNDTLIQLGDVVDRFPESYECVNELLKIKNLISIRGNHDDWFCNWIQRGVHGSYWSQGAESTLRSYIKHAGREIKIFDTFTQGVKTDFTYYDVNPLHIQFFMHQNYYYIDDQNRCFVHGGFNRHKSIVGQPYHILMWDRDLWYGALSTKGIDELKFKIYDDFKEVFIGHTSTTNWDTDQPMYSGKIWNLDTGGGGKGKLTIMNVDTKEYHQSDNVETLYTPEEMNFINV